MATEKHGITVYCCGGGGINIGSAFEDYRHHTEPGMATISNVYVDTSRSNLKPNFKEENIYILPEVDGSGGERRFNSKAIMEHAKEIVQRHKPGFASVVLSSAAGGSGAVMAAIIAKTLLDMDELVIGITVGSQGSGVEIKNTLDTLKTYEGVVEAAQKTLPIAYFENNKDTPPTEVDSDISQLLVNIAVLFSRKNEGLDSRDLYNFLHFDRLTDYKPHAAGLETYAGRLSEEDCKDTIAVVSAISTKDNNGIDFVVPYSKSGILPEMDQSVKEGAPIHLVIKAYPFNAIARRLKEVLEEMKRVAESRTVKSEVLSGDEALTGGFLSL